MHTVLLVLGGTIAYHHYPETTQILSDVLAKAGYGVKATSTPPAETDLAGVDAVVLFTDNDFLPDDAITRLANFIRRGHGMVTMHTAANTSVNNADIGTLVGSRVRGGLVEKHTAHIVDTTHPITQGLSDFEIDDEIHDLEPFASYITLVDAEMKGTRQPLVYVKPEGSGRTVHLAHGHAISGVTHPAFQEIFRRSVKWAVGG